MGKFKNFIKTNREEIVLFVGLPALTLSAAFIGGIIGGHMMRKDLNGTKFSVVLDDKFVNWIKETHLQQ